ncbi:Chloramphenicol acetyltransferase-like domain-containing protein [Artemisia annua]|uniref:Chloramphenicol acetyltransferase-like domain-containing protein n=1 Tax=Artemisia annua TaxID=35608 RepID=A0A2U1PUR1_ARTAN|nr:Chloramphenicol acetyltransferase-like domain-containing protein [Artemisia annua]
MTNIGSLSLSSNASSNVQVKEAVMITPSSTTPSHVLKLSSIDSQLFLRFTIEYLLIFRPEHDLGPVERSMVVARVKEALSRALVPYYPLSGRVKARPDGSCLEVVCRGQGAVFVESVSDFNVTDFERAPRFVTEWRKLLMLEVTDVLKGAPPLVVQLTWLSDGSVALGVGFSHCICDGIGSVAFLRYFAELATGLNSVEFKPKPIWERHLLDPKNYSFGPSQGYHPEFNQVTDHCKFLIRFNQGDLTPTSTTFHEWRINELKSLVASTSPLNKSQLTSFEVVSAHIWRSWARALNFPPQQKLKLLFSINIRNRVKPSLPSEYYGNAIVLGCAQTTAKELTENGLFYATELIREAKNRVNDAFVREVIESVTLSRASQVPDSVGVLILSQWSNIGLESVDFGLGRPVQVSPVCTDKYCILLPVHNSNRSIKSMLAVPSIAVEKYEHLMRTLE